MNNLIDEDEIIENEKEYSQRLPKQFGDFAEQLVLFYLGHSKKMKVAYIDHVGADLLATELSGLKRKIAVSVKGRIFKDIPDKAFRFDMDNQKKLRKTAKDFGNDYIPVVAFVSIDDLGDNTIIRIIIGILDQFIKLQNDATCDFITDGYSTFKKKKMKKKQRKTVLIFM